MKYVYHYHATAQVGLDAHHFDGIFTSEHPVADHTGYRDMKDRIADKGQVPRHKLRVESLTLIYTELTPGDSKG